jgi:hypothetical protein
MLEKRTMIAKDAQKAKPDNQSDEISFLYCSAKKNTRSFSYLKLC